MIDRRPIIEKYLEPGWVIVKPTPNNPGYIDDHCVFQKPDEHKETQAGLPIRWFTDGEYAKIEQEIRRAINQAYVK